MRSPLVILYEVTTNKDQQLDARWTNAPSVKTSKAKQSESMPELPPTGYGVIFIFFLNITCPLSCVSFSKTSSYLSASAKQPFTCLSQQNIIWHNWVSYGTRNFYLRGLSCMCFRVKPSPLVFQLVPQPTGSGCPDTRVKLCLAKAFNYFFIILLIIKIMCVHYSKCEA